MTPLPTWREWDELQQGDRAQILEAAELSPALSIKPWRALAADVRLTLIDRSVSMSKALQVLDCDLGGRVRSNAWAA